MNGIVRKRYLVLMALRIALSSAIGLSSTAYAAEIRVPEDRPTIQACIDNAAPGDTCSVAPGIYTENAGHVVRGVGVHVLVSKPVTIVARELYQSTLDGLGSPGAFFGIEASAEIRGFVIQNVGFGIVQLNAVDARWNVRNVIVRNVSYALLWIVLTVTMDLPTWRTLWWIPAREPHTTRTTPMAWRYAIRSPVTAMSVSRVTSTIHLP